MSLRPWFRSLPLMCTGLALLLASLAIGWAVISSRVVSVPEHEVASRPVQVIEDGYVSSDTCQACHPAQYATWHGSFHRTMTQVATPKTVRADFNRKRVTDVYGVPMLLQRRGTEFWAEFDDPDQPGARSARISRQIVMTTGSHHQQVYWYRTDRTRVLGQLPAMYLIAEDRWIPRISAFLTPPVERPGSETGRWNRVCINCHVTHGKQRSDTPFGSQAIEAQTVDTTVAEFGIACESCHGPSEQHATVNRNPIRRYRSYVTGKMVRTTSKPTRLDPKLSSQVCGQCHSVWDFYDQSAERQANWVGLPYRPGEDLLKQVFVAQPTRNMDSKGMKILLAKTPTLVKDSFWSDGMVRVSGREYNGLLESPCFKNATEGARTLTCFSCHTMHKTPDDSRSIPEWADTHQVSAGMEGNNACLSCHATIRTSVTTHTKHAPDSTGSSCYNCHMPYTSYGLLRALRSHQISSPTVTASLQTGRPNACNLCHLDKTLSWTAENLQKWYGIPSVALDKDQQSTAASLLWLLRGDAGQRALVAWGMGWQPAQKTSGSSWMALYLAQLLADPYDAVRLISYRSLRSLPGFSDFQNDFLAPASQRLSTATRAADIWWETTRATDRRTDEELLFHADGSPKADLITGLGRQRDDRPVLLRE